MALNLPTEGPTGHISWAARGWEYAVEGHTPITAPGALEGWRFSEVFRRREDDPCRATPSAGSSHHAARTTRFRPHGVRSGLPAPR